MLGFMISNGRIRPVAQQLDMIAEWKVPWSVRDVQSLYGTLSYFRSYILNFARKAACISMLLWEGVELKWMPKHTVTVNALLNETRSYKGLRVPRSDMPFTMDVGVSYDGYDGILCQDKWPVVCTSKRWDIALNEGDEVVPTERVL